jgi:type I restriction enzyme S subunit
MSNYQTWGDFLDSRSVDWNHYQLGELFAHRQDKNHPELPLLAVTGKGGIVDRDTLERRDTSNVDKSKYLRVCKDDIAYNTMRMWQGVSGLSPKEGIVSPAYTILAPKDGIDSNYAKYLFKLKLLIQVFHRNSQGLVNDTLNLKYANFSPINVRVPPLTEQQKIASILTSVDDVIEKTQSQINKLQDLKKATMNELLTKGIGHTEFKDSPVGRIPKGWEVKLLDEVTLRGSGHTPNKKRPEYWNGGIKWVSLADSFRLDDGYICETDKEISIEGLNNSSAVLHPAGTVVMSRDAGIGKTAILNSEMAVSQHFMAWRCDERMDSWFLYYLLQMMKPRFESIAMGSTIKTIGLSYFKKLTIQYPPIYEQGKISSIVKSIEKNINNKKRKLEETKSLKKALMQDLLTGKVRVPLS